MKNKKILSNIKLHSGIATIAILNIIIILALFGINKTALNFKPASSDITSISIIDSFENNMDYVTDHNIYNLNGLMATETSQIEITNNNAIKIVSKNLNDTIRKIKTFKDNENTKVITVKYVTENSVKYRNIIVSNNEYDKLTQLINDKLQDDFYIDIVKDAVNNSDHEKEVLLKLKDEIKNIDINKWKLAVKRVNSEDISMSYYDDVNFKILDVFTITKTSGNYRFLINVPVCDFMKGTSNVFLKNFDNEHRTSRNSILSALKFVNANKNKNIDIFFNNKLGKDHLGAKRHITLIYDKDFEKLYNNLNKFKNEIPTIDDSYIGIKYYSLDIDETDEYSTEKNGAEYYYFKIDADEFFNTESDQLR